MTNTSYDLIVIGAGSGGIACANQAAQYGANVAIIEKNQVGGTCVNLGCVPKKIMWYGAEIAQAITHLAPNYGLETSTPHLNFKTLVANRNAYIARSQATYTRQFETNQVTYITGTAHFLDQKTVQVGDTRLTADHILIATGSRPKLPDIPGSDLGITSDQVFEWEELPKSLAIVGGGYIAVEMASIFAALGVETHLFFRHNRPLRQLDEVITEPLLTSMQKEGIHLHPNHQVTALKRSNGQICLTDMTNTHTYYDQVLWAIGRVPNSETLGLETIGVDRDKNGFIIVNNYQETTISHILSLGDVTNAPALTPVAIKTGRLLADRLFGGYKDAKMDFNLIPTVIFSHPPIGTIGLSEKEAIDRYGKENIHTYHSQFRAMQTALGEHPTPSQFQLVTLGKEERIIGLQGFGIGIDEMIQGFAVAMKMGATKADFDATVAIHPTSAEEFVTMR